MSDSFENTKARDLVAAVEAVESGLGWLLMRHRPDLLCSATPMPDIASVVHELRRLRDRD